MQAEFKLLDKIIGALLGTQRTRLTAPTAIARAAGKLYDDARVSLFQTLATKLLVQRWWMDYQALLEHPASDRRKWFRALEEMQNKFPACPEEAVGATK